MENNISTILDSAVVPFVIAKSSKVVKEDSSTIEIVLSIDSPLNVALNNLIYSKIQSILLQHNIHKELKIQFKSQIIAHKIKKGLSRNQRIKNIIVVTSGKGGVGKSTVSYNLATTLVNLGAKVGLLDCDIYGPSIPRLCGEVNYKPAVEDSLFVPLSKNNLQIMSFGFLIAENQPVIWRASMVNKAIEQMLMDSKWDNLDYLVIDMPPGTGDIQLTMAQHLPITATVTITTPQELSLVDVKKSIAMFAKLEIPNLGLVENMSSHICSNCGHIEDIFGTNALDKLHQENIEINLLGKLPLNIAFCDSASGGVAAVESNAEIATLYQDIAINILSELSKLGKDFSSSLSKINVKPTATFSGK